LEETQEEFLRIYESVINAGCRTVEFSWSILSRFLVFFGAVQYGRIQDISIKAPPRGPAFAFIEFEDSRDAEDAVRGRDGYEFDRQRLRVEISRGGRFAGRSGGGGGGGGSGGGGAPPSRSEFRVLIHGLPRQTSWQDLKDHVRPIVAEIGFADVRGDGVGVVEFMNRDDMEYAIRKLHDSELRNRFGDRGRVTVERDGGGGRDSGKDRRRSRSRSRSRSRERKPKKEYRDSSRSRSRGKDDTPPASGEPARDGSHDSARDDSRDRAKDE